MEEYIRKEYPCKFFNIYGKEKDTTKLAAHRRKMDIATAWLLKLLGNISEISTKTTGPRENPKEAKNPMIQNKTK